ncbi:single-stranded DNA-binding protein RIM1 [Elsinoe australis]|uniref:Single-stranded DNA-binding protein RIM1 n=1 Tax=Elsinoe australis TaxID=40998 RepID=A0A2P8A7Y2_9PEZI|nr:Single-stranded DNA-binding protein RIM1, mitochondrial [Elsinoe australis]TKX25901.1 single-stranded DNA-binding protein RIM1 [Elsinoe australis]
MLPQRALRRTLGAAQRSFSTTSPQSLARMQLIGRLADKPEVITTQTGRELVRYALGVSAGPKDESGNRQTSWFRVASFSEGPQKDYLLGLQKGTQVYLDADARMDTFQAADGSNQSRLNLVQRNLETLSRPRNLNEDGSGKDAAEEPLSGVGAS